ncbi:MAG: LytTR family transcriptional regulator DNA-binding domain-containing protein [Clostridiales bacterium]|nr:LytTR family transcriptional regulator DNA-binding domain-containing protein [Clostridiales bacterium]
MRIEKRQVDGKPLTVIVEYPEWNRTVDNLVKKISKLDASIIGKKDDGSVMIDLFDIYYIENVERKLFIYTGDDVYRLEGSMADIENASSDYGFVRISRTCIMNIEHLKEIRQIRNSHLEAVMDNDEKLIVSRKYLSEIKKMFKRESL